MYEKYENIVNSLRYCAENDCSPECPRAGIGKGCISGLKREAAEAIEELLSERDEVNADSRKTAFEVERDEHRWIPVTERLPEKNGSYLVYVYGEVTEMNCWHGKWHRLGDDYTKSVTHWMSLPHPPKEE